MGIKLLTEVLTAAPEELGPSERMVLVVLAEDARDATRESWAMKPAELGRRAGLKPAALQKAFQRLAKAGLEVRVPLKVGKDGRPVYAFEGKKCTYRLPHLKRVEEIPPSEDGTDSGLSEEEGGADSILSPQEGGTGSGLSVQEGGTDSYQGGTQSTLWASEGGTDSSEGGTGSTPTPQYPSSTSSPTEKKDKGGAGGKASRKADTEHSRFAEFYTAYPIKKARANAIKAFNKAIADGADPDAIIRAVEGYAREVKGRDPKYIKHPATWLNSQCWLDEPTAPPQFAATGTDGPNRFGVLADVNAVDWSKGFKMGGNRQ